MTKLKNMNHFAKIIISLVLIVGFFFAMQSNLESVGYISLFGGLFILFEGFGFSLIIKILIALFIGLIIPLLSIEKGLIPIESIVVIRPVGSVIFMNCLTMALVPLVFSSILTGVTSLGDLQRLNRIGIKTIVYYIVTTAIAITIGLGLANIIQPGHNLDPNTKMSFQQNYASDAQAKVSSASQNKKTLFQTIQDIFPKNILESVSLKKPQMLQLIFFAVISGIALLKIERDKAEPIIQFFEGMTEMTVQIVIMVMRLAPYGIFALIASTVAMTKSVSLLIALIPFSICVLLGLFIHGVGTNFISLKLLSGRDPIAVFKSIKEVAATAFSTSSSGATMPLTLKVTQKDLNVRKEISSFVIPLGATINMDGTALFQGVSALFLANIYNIPLSPVDQLTVIAMAVMASIGTAAVPGVGIVILTMILVSVGIPPEGILFILPVNNLLDMFRTVVNVTGDVTCSIFIESSEAKSNP